MNIQEKLKNFDCSLEEDVLLKEDVLKGYSQDKRIFKI
jgi:hypothetical protein